MPQMQLQPPASSLSSTNAGCPIHDAASSRHGSDSNTTSQPRTQPYLYRLSLTLGCALLLLAGCKSQPTSPAVEHPAVPAASGAPKIYVTNEVSGDLSIIDSGNWNTLATVPLGKRPRGIHPSPDGKTLYIALSGTPIAGADVDESTLPPPDKRADGIGVFDVAQQKIVR